MADEETPTAPHPPPRGTRLGSIFHQSASLFEHSPFFSIGEGTGDEAEENRRALKTAFYNTAFAVFVGVIFYTCVQVFYIFEFCIRPLLWALLLGAVLYPLKEMGKQLILFGLDTLENSGAPLLLGLFLLPFISVQRLLVWIADVTTRTYKEMAIAMLILTAILLTDMVDIIDHSNDIISSVSVVANIALEALEQCSYVVWTAAAAYLIFVCFWWQPNTMPYVEWLAIPIWALSIATLISFLGQWRDLIAICVFGILGCGTYAALIKKKYSSTEPGTATKPPLVNKHILIAPQPGCSSTPIPSSSLHQGPGTKPPFPPVTPATTRLGGGKTTAFNTPTTTMKNKTRFHTPGTTRPLIDAKKVSQKFLEQGSGDKISTVGYFSVLGWSVAFTLMGRHIFLVIRISSFLLIFIVLYKLYKWLDLSSWLQTLFGKVQQVAGRGRKFKALCPPSARGLAILMKDGQNFVLDILRSSTNQVVSASIIFLMILTISLAAFFIVYTVHSEILYLLQATSYFINNHIQTSEHLQNLNTSLSAWSLGLSSVHSAGRGWIRTKISLLPEGNSTRDLESTLLSLYDNMYEQWIERNISTTRTNVTLNHLITTVKGNMHSLDGVVSLNTAKSNLVHLLSGKCSETPANGTFLANYILCSKGMLVDVVNSLWSILSSNMTVLLQLAFSFIGGVVESGAAFLNLVLQTAVFISALYYLLLYSNEYYAPVEFITSLLPASVDKVAYTNVLFEATRGIFGASLKLSVFYGCYVWVTHTAFGLEMVFLPALVAGVFSVVPVIGVYWSSVPGFLVLWLVDGRTLRAFSFLILQILPTYFIDMAVYSGLEGGWHPYITGLAVAGGLYYFGLEGAFIGPLVICILKFTINIYECVHENLNLSKTKIQ